jgi:hypothetical protein
MGMPWIPARLCTATEVYMVDCSDISLMIARDLEVKPIIGNPEIEQSQISAAFAVKVEHRNWHGKQTAVNA